MKIFSKYLSICCLIVVAECQDDDTASCKTTGMTCTAGSCCSVGNAGNKPPGVCAATANWEFGRPISTSTLAFKCQCKADYTDCLPEAAGITATVCCSAPSSTCKLNPGSGTTQCIPNNQLNSCTADGQYCLNLASRIITPCCSTLTNPNSGIDCRPAYSGNVDVTTSLYRKCLTPSQQVPCAPHGSKCNGGVACCNNETCFPARDGSNRYCGVDNYL